MAASPHDVDAITQTTASTPRSTSPGLDLERGVLDKDEDKVPLEVTVLPYSSSGTRTSSDVSSYSTSMDHLSPLEKRVHANVTNVVRSVRRRSSVSKVEAYLRGPLVAPDAAHVKPFFPRIESFFDRLFAPIHRRKFLLPIFLAAWFLAFLFFVRSSYFTSHTQVGTPSFISADASFWLKDDGCGLNGSGCGPFSNSSMVFRCPAQALSVQLLNYDTVGPQQLIFDSLVVGGFDAQKTYRADSWICVAAMQQGLFGNQRGGCGALEQTGAFTGYVGGDQNGVSSVGFDSTFPSSYRFLETVSTGDCQDYRNEILALNVIMSILFSFVMRPSPVVFFWVLFMLGYWQIVLVSDARSFPPDVSSGIQFFLPALFVGWAFWKVAFQWVVPAFERAVLERTVLYLAGFWIGVLMNISLAWIPITQLTSKDIAKRPGGLIAVIVIGILLFLVIANQIRVIRKTGHLVKYLGWYALGAIFIAALSSIPGYQFRLHHYVAAIALMPGTAFVTRPSAVFQGFLLGMFLNGVGRWGFDTILATVASLVGDGSLGTQIPTFLTNSTNFSTLQSTISWIPISSSLSSTWDGFELIVDDVLVYAGSSTNFSIAALTAGIPHYFRLAYTLSGNSGDFGKAATAFIRNGTWIDAASGAGG